MSQPRVSRRSSYLLGVAPPALLRWSPVDAWTLLTGAAPARFVDEARLSPPSEVDTPPPLPHFQAVPPPALPPAPALALPPQPNAARLEDAPPWLWGVLGAMLASGGGRIAPALLSAPFVALAGVNQRRQDVYERGVRQALDAYRLALAGWEAETGRRLQRYRTEQEAAETAYQGALRTWLAEQQARARELLQRDKQAFQLELQRLRDEAAALRASGRDASALERAIVNELAQAASNPSLSAAERAQWANALNTYLATGELPTIQTEPSIREESPFISALLAAARNPNLSAAERAAAQVALANYLQSGQFAPYPTTPSIPEQLAPSRIDLQTAQAVLARARVPEAQARAQYLLTRARDIAQRDIFVGQQAQNPAIHHLFANLRREIQVYGDLAARALTNYRGLLAAGEEAAAAAMWQEYEHHAQRLNAAIERLRQLQQQTRTQLVSSQSPQGVAAMQSLLQGNTTSQRQASPQRNTTSQRQASPQRNTTSPPTPLTGRLGDIPVIRNNPRRQRPPAFAGR